MVSNWTVDDHERFFSFQDFPADVSISERDLASAGFTYSGRGDEVFCKSCQLKYRGWKADDDPMVIHRLSSPACPFMINKSDSYSPVGLDRTQGQQEDINRPPVSFINHSIQHPNRPRGDGNNSSFSIHHGNPNHMQINDNNLMIEDDIYNGPDITLQPPSHNSIRGPSLSSENRNPRWQVGPEVQTRSQIRDVQTDDRIQQNLNLSHQNNVGYRGNHWNTPTLPPVSTTVTNSQTAPTSVTVQRNSPVPRQNVSQRPVLIEEPTPQRNPYNMSEISNSLPQNTSTLNTQQPYMVRSNDEAMELVDDLQQQREAQDWYTGRDRTQLQTITPQPLDYTDFNVRLNSFRGRWSAESPVQPLELAEAGLYFTGPNDRVQCAWCRGGLYGWEPNDTAFGEHRRHFPQCWFVKEKLRALLEGQSFVPPPDPYPGETLRTQLPTVQQQQVLQEPLVIERPTTQQRTPQPVPNVQPNQWQVMPPQAPQRQPNLQSPRSDMVKQSIIAIVQNMGYDIDMINRAMQRLGRDVPLTTDNLIDSLYELEEIEDVENAGAIGMTQEDTVSVLDDKSTEQLAQNETEDPTTSQINSLKQENARLRESTRCRFCGKNEVDMLFLPCRHLVSCETCAQKATHCPLCQQTISGMVKTFLP